MHNDESDPQFQAFFQRLLDKSARLRLPELFRSPPADALYYLPNREGVSVVALRTADLSYEQLLKIMTYRLAQYVVLHYVNLQTVYEAGLDHESFEFVSPNDVHVIAGSPESGEILCYFAIKSPPKAPPDTTLRTRDRPLFPTEEIFGWGVFNRLSIVPDLPITRLWEFERFVKNQQREVIDDLTARGPVELSLAVLRLLTGRLAAEIDACLVDIEEGVKAKKMWEFFHVPSIVLHGVIPYVAREAYPFPSYEKQTRYPTAFLCSDIPLSRLETIEQALTAPGKQGLAALFHLKADPNLNRSSLEPPEGLGALTDASVPQQGVPMEARRKILDVGEWLRTMQVFRDLSVAEAAVLATFLERRAAAPGDVLVRQGEVGDDLYLIEAGSAAVEIVAKTGQRTRIAMLERGDCFGEIALVAGGPRTADVVALGPTTLLRLSKEAYTRYLAQEAEVDRQLTHTALSRSRETMRYMAAAEAQSAALANLFHAALPADSIVADPLLIEQQYRRNVTALTRVVPLALRPRHEEEVRRIVEVARTHHIPLYPFSTGKNWGLGSKLPVADGCVLVDLVRMNRIVEVNQAFAYAIIEPGVTQGQLAAYLREHHPTLAMNLTGSVPHTSVVGNVLDRGDGAYARIHDLLGVRGVLGNGQPFAAGGIWGQVGKGVPSHCSKHVAGPDLTGLFSQSSFGIITQMAFRLIHKPERCYIFWGTVRDRHLEQAVDTFDAFGRQGAINRGSVNIGYANRFVQASRSMRGAGHADDDTPWSFYVQVPGMARVADAVVEELRAAFEPICVTLGALRTDTEGDPYTELPKYLHPLVKPLMGMPDPDSIKLIYHLTSTPIPADPLELDVDYTAFGMKCYVAVIPHRGEYARQAACIVFKLAGELDLNLKLSFFGDGRALTTIHFRSDDPEQVRRAERCEAALWDAMNAAGFPPYRASIDQMARLIELQPEFFDLVAQLKSVLDPSSIISPGRYSPRFALAPGLRAGRRTWRGRAGGRRGAAAVARAR